MNFEYNHVNLKYNYVNSNYINSNYINYNYIYVKYIYAPLRGRALYSAWWTPSPSQKGPFLYILSFKYFKHNYCLDNFEVNQYAYQTRRANVLLKIPNTTCSAGSHSAHYLLPCKWNELVNSPHCHIITNSNTIHAFKKSVKSMLLNEQL